MSRDMHASFSFFFSTPLSLVPSLSLEKRMVPSMSYRWRSRASYARSEAIRYRVRACVHNIRMWHLSPGSRATCGRGKEKIDLVPSPVWKGGGGGRSTIGCRTTRPDPLRLTRKSGGKAVGEDLSRRVCKERSRSRGWKEAPDIFLFLSFGFLRAISFRSFVFIDVTSRKFIARIRRKIDGLLMVRND